MDATPPGAAVVDLLGVLAHGELTAFIRMAVDADLAPTLALKASMGQVACTDFARFTQLVEHMRARGIDPDAAMAPFVTPITAFHERTRPKGWLEGLVKAYVGDGIAKDFYREMSAFVDEDTRAAMRATLEDDGHADFIVQIVRDTIRSDRRAAGRLALWGRRLLGEALSQAQAVAVERDAMAALLVGGGADLAEVGRMFTRLTDNHQARMARLGLEA
ncbi:ferritin-like fold-containing protein [Phycicoccus duodecadis]|uniref:tRNA-(MS[2]IO[6]A)-hydroxylase MiaE-like protein n=1 Tax=Phycicoccus duodecadis TaxID=173053 RepID=A0A2N3YH23_9MICO|nr:ferritin-like fold-containing protein [Phycicoccus duodecadis]PKW26130.1 tRNA-(MS[2]IO[6]A)-hydroxylase MiaE-like protein [Phycicoccus duodecadis]